MDKNPRLLVFSNRKQPLRIWGQCITYNKQSLYFDGEFGDIHVGKQYSYRIEFYDAREDGTSKKYARIFNFTIIEPIEFLIIRVTLVDKHTFRLRVKSNNDNLDASKVLCDTKEFETLFIF